MPAPVSYSFHPPPQTYIVVPTGCTAIRKKSRMDTVSGTVVGGTVVGGTVVGALVVVGMGAVVVGAGTAVVGGGGWVQPQSSSARISSAVKRFMSIIRLLCFFLSNYTMAVNKKQGALAFAR